MSYFKNIVNKFKETNLKLGEVAIACELAAHNEFLPLSDDDFETVCEYCYDYYMSSEVSAQELVDVVVELLLKHAAGLDETDSFSIEKIKEGYWSKLDDIVADELCCRF